MTTTELERRVSALEKKIENLAVRDGPSTNKDWVLKMWGTFAGDADFEKAMRHGRQWRKAGDRKPLRDTKSRRSKR